MNSEIQKYCPQCLRQYPPSEKLCRTDRTALLLQDPCDLVGRTLAGKYRIDALIGAGGMGAVYSAHNLKLDRHIAFKTLLPNLAVQQWAVRMFEKEAKTAGRLRHENIVDITDADIITITESNRVKTVPYIAMEWLEGETLEDRLDAGLLELADTAEILRQMAAALAEAHAHSTVHRDLKPGNVMLVRQRDKRELVKVLDFGIGKLLTEGALVSRIAGTPYYASPEQRQMKAEIDGRSDIYSLGVMLFQMLTGRLPFYGSEAELIEQHRSAPPPSLRFLRPGIPPGVEELVMRMLAKQPAQRPADISEVPPLFDAACRAGAVTLLEPEAPPKPSEARQTERHQPTYAPPIVQPRIEREPDPPPRIERKPDPPPRVEREPDPRYTTNNLPAPPVSPQSSRRRLVLGASAVLVPLIALAVYWTSYSGGTQLRASPPVGAGQSITENLSNGVKLEMIALPGGEFSMGSNDGPGDEKPIHQVKVSPFAIGKYEVTQGQWQAVMGSNPSNFKGDDLPVEGVSWEEATEFCKKLSALTGKMYRLPTEAEWEYAARGGNAGKYGFGDDESLLGQYAWFSGNSGGKTHPVRQKKPNAFGLYDMHGNVWEWCSDWYSENYYAECHRQGVVTDPRGPSTGSNRVNRGGGWNFDADYCRSANRYRLAPGYRYDILGLRLLRIDR